MSIEIDHIHFVVKDAIAHRDRLVRQMGFQQSASLSDSHTQTEIMKSGPIYFVLSSPLDRQSPASSYLESHAEGAIDIALQVPALEPFLNRSEFLVGEVQTQQLPCGTIKSTQVAGWGSLRHTLIENETGIAFCDVAFGQSMPSPLAASGEEGRERSLFKCIDHAVLNVPTGELEGAIAWYRDLFGLEVRQSFNIQTQNSGLKSQVLSLPNDDRLYLNVNEPTSANSQIQEFLDFNGGSGIQHIALRTDNILNAVSQLRQLGQSFLAIPQGYYKVLQKRLTQSATSIFSGAELQKLQDLEVLADWKPESPTSLLLQIFTPPIFAQPTFFFELIERRSRATGFGEGNFQTLFEAVEKEQINRERSLSHGE